MFLSIVYILSLYIYFITYIFGNQNVLDHKTYNILLWTSKPSTKLKQFNKYVLVIFSIYNRTLNIYVFCQNFHGRKSLWFFPFRCIYIYIVYIYSIYILYIYIYIYYIYTIYILYIYIY